MTSIGFPSRLPALLGIRHPILQAGMSWASSCWELPLAVSRAGALGVIAAGPMYPEKLLEAIRGGAYGRGGGGVGPGLERTTLRGDWDKPRFALALARKDLGLATDLASEFAVPMPLAAMAEQALIECMNRGWGGKDMTAAFALQEERAKVEVRVSAQIPQ